MKRWILALLGTTLVAEGCIVTQIPTCKSDEMLPKKPCVVAGSNAKKGKKEQMMVRFLNQKKLTNLLEQTEDGQSVFCCDKKLFWKNLKKFSETSLYKEAEDEQKLCEGLLKKNQENKELKYNKLNKAEFIHMCVWLNIRDDADLTEKAIGTLMQAGSGMLCPYRLSLVQANLNEDAGGNAPICHYLIYKDPAQFFKTHASVCHQSYSQRGMRHAASGGYGKKLMRKYGHKVDPELKDCWDECGKKEGSCDFCGENGYCCSAKKFMGEGDCAPFQVAIRAFTDKKHHVCVETTKHGRKQASKHNRQSSEKDTKKCLWTKVVKCKKGNDTPRIPCHHKSEKFMKMKTKKRRKTYNILYLNEKPSKELRGTNGHGCCKRKAYYNLLGRFYKQAKKSKYVEECSMIVQVDQATERKFKGFKKKNFISFCVLAKRTRKDKRGMRKALLKIKKANRLCVLRATDKPMKRLKSDNDILCAFLELRHKKVFHKRYSDGTCKNAKKPVKKSKKKKKKKKTE